LIVIALGETDTVFAVGAVDVMGALKSFERSILHLRGWCAVGAWVRRRLAGSGERLVAPPRLQLPCQRSMCGITSLLSARVDCGRQAGLTCKNHDAGGTQLTDAHERLGRGGLPA
jgi:hypothetical protein